MENHLNAAAHESDAISADAWFAAGERVGYDPSTAAITKNGPLHIFRRVVSTASRPEPVTVTMMPGYPDGSFGWARVERHLASEVGDRIYVEYVGQGDSDKPRRFPHSISSRADVVEANWRDLGVERAHLVAFDYSSMVALELLHRQICRQHAGVPSPTTITGLVSINGGLFADGHTHPWLTTPVFDSAAGPIVTWIGQRWGWAFAQLFEPMFSRAYDVQPEELREIHAAISRRDGMRFVADAAGFVKEHQQNADRLNFARISASLGEQIDLTVVASKRDALEGRQVILAAERVDPSLIRIESLKGGHLATSEQPKLLAEIITASVSRVAAHA